MGFGISAALTFRPAKRSITQQFQSDNPWYQLSLKLLKFLRLGNPRWLGTAVLAYAEWPTGRRRTRAVELTLTRERRYADVYAVDAVGQWDRSATTYWLSPHHMQPAGCALQRSPTANGEFQQFTVRADVRLWTHLIYSCIWSKLLQVKFVTVTREISQCMVDVDA